MSAPKPQFHRALLAMVLPAFVAACSSKPPPDYAPNPGLVSQITELRMITSMTRVCPGRTIEARYQAVLADGRVVPFARKYDKDNPPPLHVIFLRRWSTAAVSRESGDWDTEGDPLVTAMDGFQLHAELRAKPALAVSTVVEPEYSCTGRAFRFDGPTGKRGEPGYPGPDVLVRVGTARSPFYHELLVVGVQVGEAPTFYLLQDARAVPPSDWLVIESRGGRGGRGLTGEGGARGAPGRAGCPGTRGGVGGPGGAGGLGGPGGSGGHVTVMAPTELPYLAGLIEGRSPGGGGGAAGPGGRGGRGGQGGEGVIVSGQRCGNGPAGERGPTGPAGSGGQGGAPGPRARVITVSADDVFGQAVPPTLQTLLDYARR